MIRLSYLIVFLVLCISTNVFAEIQYRVLSEAFAPNVQSISFVNASLAKSEFNRLDLNDSGLIPGVLVDQVWMRKQYQQFVYLKLGVEPISDLNSNEKIDGIIPFMKGYLWHLKLPTGSSASIYFHGIPLSEVEALATNIASRNAKNYFSNMLVNRAYADTCSKSPSTMPFLYDASKKISSVATDMTWSLMQCLVTSVTSANQTVKQMVSMDTLKKLFQTPSQIYHQAVDATEKLFEVNAQVSRGLQKVLSEGMSKEELEQIFPLICSASGTIFSGTLIGILTAGVGARSFEFLLENLLKQIDFAKRMAKIKLKNGSEILSCVVQKSAR